MREMTLDIEGLGFILYSPTAVAHIEEGTDYLQHHFSDGADVARHVMECQLTAFGTGSPGTFVLRFIEGSPPEQVVEASTYKLRLGLEVHTGSICVRDLYDLIDWSSKCPPTQRLSLPDGWYRLTVVSSRPPSGITGDGQKIDIYFEPTDSKPQLRWEGVPTLC